MSGHAPAGASAWLEEGEARRPRARGCACEEDIPRSGAQPIGNPLPHARPIGAAPSHAGQDGPPSPANASRPSPARAPSRLPAPPCDLPEHVAREEALVDAAYCYDGTPEGLLTAVFKAYELREDPLDVVREAHLQPRLGQSVRVIDTDVQLALRVQQGVRRVCGRAAADAVVSASLSDDPAAGTVVYRFVRHAMRNGRVMNDLAHPAVAPLDRLARAVGNERHRMLQFLRFEHLDNGVWFARCNPNAAVVPLVMDWFSGRFNTQPFIIFDEAHGMAGVYEGREWHLVRSNEVTPPGRASDERLMQAAWKRFYDVVAVEARYNPELRRQFMPKRLWKNIVEMHERIPGAELSR